MQNKQKMTLQYYSNNSSHLTSRYEDAQVHNIHELLLSYFQEGSRLLELGTGSGRDAAYMKSKGYTIYGIDGSSEMIKAAEKYHPDLKGSLTQGVLPECLDKISPVYDGVYSIAALMHLNEKQLDQMFKFVSTILKTNGHFIFSVSLERDDINENGLDEKDRYFNILSKEQWLRFTQNNGFREIRSHVTDDGLAREGIRWLTCVVVKV